ncbi:MAG: caspase family protein [Lewinellaceae bacterium]|nr:caspase family protein [Lewinellaceae bacterium]
MHRNPFLLCALFLFPLLSPAQKPELVVRQEAHIGYPTVTAYSSGGQYLLSGGDDRRLVLWDIASGRFIRRTECPARPLALRFAEQDETALALLADHSVIQWDLVAGQAETLLPPAEDSILLFQLSPGGQWALTFSALNTLRVRHTRDGGLNWQLASAEAAAGLQFLPESQSVALYRSDGTVLGHWRLANGAALENPPVLAWPADSLLLDPGNGQRIYQQKNKGLAFLSLNQGMALASRALPPDAFSGAETYYMISPGAFAYAPDGRYLLATVYKTPPLFSVGGPVQSLEQATTTFLYVIDARRDSLVATHTFSGPMSGFSFSPDGRQIAGTVLEKIITFPIFGEGPQQELKSQYNEVETMVHFSPEGDKAVFTEYNNDARTWDFYNRLPLQTLGRREFISGRGAAFSPTDASIFFDGILSGSNGRMPDTLLNNHPILGWPNSAAFSADGKFLAAAMEDINFGYGVSFNAFTVGAKDVLRTLYSRNGDFIGLETKQGKVLGYEWNDESLGKGEKGLILSTGHAWVWPADGSAPPLPLYTKEQARPVGLQFTPDNKHLIGRFKNLAWLAGRWGYDTPPSQFFHIWNIREGLSAANQSGQDTILAYWVNGPEILAISPDAEEGYVLWRLSDGKNRQAFTLPAPVMAAAFSPDGTQAHCLLKGAAYGSLNMQSGTFAQVAQLPASCRSLQLSPDGRFIVFWEESRFHLWNVEQGAIVLSQGGEASLRTRIMREDPGTNGAGLNDVSSFYFLPDGKHAFSTTYEGIIRLWRLDPVREVATMIPMGRDWAVTTPSGLFDASSGAMEQVYYVVGREIVGLEQLKERYFEPGLLQKLLGYSDEPIRSVEGFKDVPLYPEIAARIDTLNQQLRITLKARGGGIGPVSVFLNGKEVTADANPKRDTALSFSLAPFGRYFLADTINRVSIRAYNREGWLKSPAFTLPYRPPKVQRKGQGDVPETSLNFVPTPDPSLYAIIIGTADYAGEKLDLSFAGRDAIAMAQAIQQAGSQLFGPGQVHIRLFTTDTTDARLFPTKANIQGAFEDIRQQARAEDVLVVYCSGHGITYGNADQAQFYYLTQDIATENLSDDGIRATRAISTEELARWINEVPALRQVMILDACNSGKVVESISGGQKNLNSSQVRALDRMKDRTGMFVLAGSAADKVSYEASQYGQGLLTYSILQGMSGFKLRDGKYVDVSLLFEYARDEVPKMAESIGGIQTPTMLTPGSGSIDIGIVNEQVHIPLSPKKPVFVRNVFLEENAYDDVLGLARQFEGYLQDISAKGARASLIYVDVPNYKEAYSIKGFYRVQGGRVNLRARLFRGATPLGDITAVENTGQLPRLVEEAIRQAIGIINN